MIDSVSLLVLSFRVALVATLIEALRRRHVPATVNALVGLVVAFLPAAVDALLTPERLVVAPALPLWIAVAGFLHSLGMLGLYDSTWWWDHLTHTVSAALVAAFLYAAALTGLLPVGRSSGVAAVATLTLTLLVGVGWELIELVARTVAERYDVDPVLVHYGRTDTLYDLVFDVVGAVFVVAFDLRLFVPVVEQLAAHL